MKTFEAKGTYKKNGDKIFIKQVKADNEKMATEYIYSLIGGKQNIRRKNIIIQELKAVK